VLPEGPAAGTGLQHHCTTQSSKASSGRQIAWDLSCIFTLKSNLQTHRAILTSLTETTYTEFARKMLLPTCQPWGVGQMNLLSLYHHHRLKMSKRNRVPRAPARTLMVLRACGASGEPLVGLAENVDWWPQNLQKCRLVPRAHVLWIRPGVLCCCRGLLCCCRGLPPFSAPLGAVGRDQREQASTISLLQALLQGLGQE